MILVGMGGTKYLGIPFGQQPFVLHEATAIINGVKDHIDTIAAMELPRQAKLVLLQNLSMGPFNHLAKHSGDPLILEPLLDSFDKHILH